MAGDPEASAFIPSVADTGLRVLEHYRRTLADTGNTLVLDGVTPAVAETLERTGVVTRIGHEHIFAATPEITRALDGAVAHANAIVDDSADPATR